MKKFIFVLALFFMTLSFSYGQIILIRPNASVGYAFADDTKGLTVNYGLKVLLFANKFQRFGILVDHLFILSDDNVSYLRAGLMLEQVLFKYFNMGIGTIGYINMVQKGENPFGIYTHLGFEYNFSKHVGILAAYQCDFIFRKPFSMNNAFQLGLGRGASNRNVTESDGCLKLKMLPKLILYLRYFTISLSESPPETQDSLVYIMLQLNRVVKRNLSMKYIFYFLRQFSRFHETYIRAARHVTNLELFGADPGFTN